MADLDRLVDSIDVDAALDQVVERHRRNVRRSRNQRLALVAACSVVLVAATWLAVRDTSGERSLDVAGLTSPERTPASVTVHGYNGLAVTVAADADRVAIGDAVQVDITVTNTGTASLAGAWSTSMECSASIGVAPRLLTGDGVAGDPTEADDFVPLGSVDAFGQAWGASRAGLGDAATASHPLVIRSLMVDLAAFEPPCPAGDASTPVEWLEPGQSRTTSATWQVWLGPGRVPADASLALEAIVSAFDCRGCTEVPVAASTYCPTCAETELAHAILPIGLDLTSRTDPPAEDQLRAAIDRPDVQAALDRFGPRTDAGPDPIYGGWLLQTDEGWRLRLRGGSGAVDVAFDGTGAVVAIDLRERSAPSAPTCATSTERIAAARTVVETSPLLALIDRASPSSVGQLVTSGQDVAVGTVLAARDETSGVPPEAGWPTPEETGVTLATFGVVLTVSTPNGDVEVPVVLALGGSEVIEGTSAQLRTTDLHALVGACVVVSYPATTGTWGPAVLAIAPGPASAPIALDPVNDVLIHGYATSDALVTAILAGS